jgi:hypothetical protein
MILTNLMSEPLLTTGQGFVLLLGIFIGLVMGSLVTFMLMTDMFKDKNDDSR